MEENKIEEREKIYKITLADGRVIEDLRLNGNNFVSKEEITDSIFNGNLSRVIINDGEHDIIFNNMELVQVQQYKDEYWFILRELTAKELQEIKTRSDIDYIAMMSDIEL